MVPVSDVTAWLLIIFQLILVAIVDSPVGTLDNLQDNWQDLQILLKASDQFIINIAIATKSNAYLFFD